MRDPDEIVRLSFAFARTHVDCRGIPPALHEVLYRMVHACGMTDLGPDLAWHGDPVAAVRSALQQGQAIIGDCEMVLAGVAVKHLAQGNRRVCTLNDPRVGGCATALGITRSAAAVELWQPFLAQAIVIIGNAPTALFRLLELLAQDWRQTPRPAAIIACPVGFIGAAESKEALLQAAQIPCLTLRGRRGGSAITAAALNAIALSAA